MATEAKVRSLDVLETFRASTIVFITKARRSVDQVGEELRRTRAWLMNEQQVHWTEQVRKRTRALDQAKAELMTARYSTLRDSAGAQEQAVRKATRALDEAMQKLDNVKRWNRDFDRLADPLSRKLEALRHYLEHTLPEGVSQIGQLHRLLESYAETSTPLPATATPAADTESNSGTPTP